MKVTGNRSIGMLVHDYDATCDFLKNDLRLEFDWTDGNKRGHTVSPSLALIDRALRTIHMAVIQL